REILTINLKTAVVDRKRVSLSWKPQLRTENESFVLVPGRENGFGSLTFWVRYLTTPIGRLALPGTAFSP
ncbi:MAG TPA: hypothetical protein PLA90_16875, partial [Candidatus Sumerlaeota bacterium]|nr:hypothetical protein [Candidatus Sumerlaeota bacterium]